MHQDHGNSPATCFSAIENGFTRVMMDGSLKEDGKTPADYDYNVQVTTEVVKLAHAAGRLGRRRTRLPRLARNTAMGEQEDGHGAEGKLIARSTADRSRRSRTSSWPTTGVDALAVAIGTSHGAYKFTRKPDGEVLAMDRDR